MGDPLLIDSSMYISLLRAGEDPGARFRDRIETGSILTCGIIRIEVLRGIVNRRIREWMERLFDEMVACPLDDTLVRGAADLAWRLDRRGIILPVPDILIASCALRARAAVVAADPHFRLVPDLSVLGEMP